MNVAALIRVSTYRQAEQGASLDAQARRFAELADRNGWNVVEVLRGHESGTARNADRAILMRALELVQDGSIDALWVYEHSRLTRADELEVALLKRELHERGCRVIVQEQIIDLDDPGSHLTFDFYSLMGRDEVRRFKERSRRGREEKAKQGKWHTAKAAYGYVNPLQGDPRRGTLQVVEDEAMIVRRIFAAYLAGSSITAIANALRDEGVPSPKGATWGGSAVRRVLMNPVYCGTVVLGRWRHEDGKVIETVPTLEVENAHEPIVSRSDWDAAQDRIASRKARGRKPAMLTGLMHVDGKPVYADSNGGNRRYYRVRDTAFWIRREEIEPLVWERFRAMVLQPSVLLDVLSDEGEAGPDLERMAAMHRATIQRLERRMDGLILQRAEEGLERERFDRLANATRTQLRQARAALAECEKPPTVDPQSVIDAVVRGMNAKLPHNRRALLEMLVPRIDLACEKHDRKWRPMDLQFECGYINRKACYSTDKPTDAICVLRGGKPVLERVRAAIATAERGRQCAS